MRNRPAVGESRHEDDVQVEGVGARSRCDQTAAIRAPSSQNGAEYCAEMKLPENAATISDAASADASPGGPREDLAALTACENAVSRK